MEWQTLVWDTPASPDGDKSFYDHVMAETPFGRILIEWKSWKDYPTYTIQMPWFPPDGLLFGNSLEDAKIVAQNSFNNKLNQCVAPTHGKPIEEKE